MKSPIRTMVGAALLALALPAVAIAQVSTNRVAANTDWSVFVEGSPQECWGVSAPKESLNTKDGKAVSVRRGDILLFVTFHPGSAGEVSFTGGYPFEPGSTVGLDVGGTKFDMLSDGEWAWPGTPEDDAKIIAALKAGSSAIMTAHSARGTQTQDTFSLNGFSAAMEEALKRCAG
jgi:hypothetical protein